MLKVMQYHNTLTVNFFFKKKQNFFGKVFIKKVLIFLEIAFRNFPKSQSYCMFSPSHVHVLVCIYTL